MRLGNVRPRLAQIYHKEIWQASALKERSLKSACFAALRIVSITATVAMETRIAIRAAALSFSSLLGLAPLLAIAILIGGFALGDNNQGQVANRIYDLLKFFAPQLQHLEAAARAAADAPGADVEPNSTPPMDRPDSAASVAAGTANSTAQINPDVLTFIDGVIKSAQSGSAGALGAFSLILIVLLLFKAIEDTFNDIWGVRQGRSVLMRIILYWTVLSLGAVLFFTAIALLSASTFLNVFMEQSDELTLGWVLQVAAFLLLTIILTLFYRVIPNTRVFWRPAFIGGLLVATLLILNQFVAFLYVKRVVLEKSLYGSLAVPFVLLGSLYIFWLFVLTGGIVSYALQNVNFRNSQAAWSTLTESMRERLSLVVFLTICRRFRDCLPPISASQLSTMLKVPTQLLNECVNRLVHLNLITTVRPPPDNTAGDYLYQPARPLNRITLFDFKTLDDNFGENPIGTSLEHIEPLIAHYDTALQEMGEQQFFQKNLEQLLDEHPFDESRPPFAMGERAGPENGS